MRTRNVIIIILVLIVLGIAAYFIFLRHPAQAPSTAGGQLGSLPGAAIGFTGNTGAAGSSASSSAAMVNVVDNGPAVAYFINPSGVATVVRPDGNVVSNVGGQATTLSTSSIADVVSAAFSHDGAKIMVSSGGLQGSDAKIFDIATQSWTDLGVGVLSPVWSPSDLRLAYLRDNGNGSLVLATFDFSKPKPSPVTLGTFYVQDVAMSWPVAGNIILSARPSAYTQSPIFTYSFSRKALVPVLAGRYGLSAVWGVGPSDVLGLAFFGSQNQRGGTLQLIDVNGAVFQGLTFLTLPSKCVFATGTAPLAALTPTSSIPTPLPQAAPSGTASGTKAKTGLSATSTPAAPAPHLYLYCGVPRDQQSIAYEPLPDAYLQGNIFTADDLYRVDVSNGNISTVLAGSKQMFDVVSPAVFGNTFYFINRYDQKLYSVSLQ